MREIRENVARNTPRARGCGWPWAINVEARRCRGSFLGIELVIAQRIAAPVGGRVHHKPGGLVGCIGTSTRGMRQISPSYVNFEMPCEQLVVLACVGSLSQPRCTPGATTSHTTPIPSAALEAVYPRVRTSLCVEWQPPPRPRPSRLSLRLQHHPWLQMRRCTSLGWPRRWDSKRRHATIPSRASPSGPCPPRC